MQPYEIALFKNFMESKAMITPFINLYKNFHIKTNPTSVEAYLSQAPVAKVLTNAFFFSVGARWGYDYWYGMQQEFLAFWRRHINDEEANDWKSMHGLSKSLRSNWDDKYWKTESRSATAKRMGFELPYDEIQREKDEARVSAEPPTQEQPTDLLAGFNIVDVQCVRKGIKDEEMTINMRGKKSSITLSQFLTAKLRDKNFKTCTLLTNSSGDVLLKFDTQGDVKVSIPESKGKVKSYNAGINTSSFTQRVAGFIGATREFQVVKAKIYAETDEYIAILVSI